MIPLTPRQLVEPPRPRRRPPFFNRDRVAIVGMTASHIHTPWFDDRWTIAAHPCTFSICQREPDWWFDLHPRACFQQKKSWNPGYYRWLQQRQAPIFMQEDWPDIPMAIRFPRERIMAEFRAYFTNHVAWMIALAITEGVTHIGLFGCEYKATQERGKQRGSVEYWIGFFEGCGRQIILPPGCSLVNDPQALYGYESHGPDGKLIGEYRTAPVVTKTEQGKSVAIPLTIIDPNKKEGRPPLRKIPGEEPAWERSGLLVYG